MFGVNDFYISGDIVPKVQEYLDQNKKPITDLTMVPLVIDYPSTEGVFVERTMNFLKKDLTRKGWTHADDVGIATIVA